MFEARTPLNTKHVRQSISPDTVEEPIFRQSTFQVLESAPCRQYSGNPKYLEHRPLSPQVSVTQSSGYLGVTYAVGSTGHMYAACGPQKWTYHAAARYGAELVYCGFP